MWQIRRTNYFVRRTTNILTKCLSNSELKDQFVDLTLSPNSINTTSAENEEDRRSYETEKDVESAVKVLEGLEGIQNPTGSDLIEGRWQLICTTRPRTASPIQRTFTGVDVFTVFQDVYLKTTNIFGDEAKGWLDTTYLSPSGNLRISRGNKGTTFVLQKETVPRQKLLSIISKDKGVAEAIDEFLSSNSNSSEDDYELLEGSWQMIWSSQDTLDLYIFTVLYSPGDAIVTRE